MKIAIANLQQQLFVFILMSLKNLLMVYFTKVEGWTETAIHVFNRHNVSDDHEGEGHQVDERVKMLQLNEVCPVCILFSCDYDLSGIMFYRQWKHFFFDCKSE